ncbi:unnamed protein product [Arabis nemorensis]|uniref:F-box domain-containing protein n=1 Tax=Arabis nemorensis TaxID=586526 RepID=A0A565AME1_9BRAS|nr:unnamed protein product [Arabis nemorensis]
MEIEEEDRTKLSSWIPLDVTIEILLRLPGKYVVRFRCVSKLWSSITTTPHFIKSFPIFTLKKEEDKRVFFSLPHHQDPQRCFTRVESYEMILPKQDPKYSWLQAPNLVKGKVFSSIRGLICFGDRDQVVIWNPTLRQHVVLPDSELSRPLITFLGYDPIEDKYKVLCMSGNDVALATREKPRVITLGAQESWRTTKHFPPGHPRGINRCVYGGKCMNGILY